MNPTCLLTFFFLFTATVFADKPNVIVVLVDDMGYSDLGSFGGEVNTPHLDRLAANGLRFTQNYKCIGRTNRSTRFKSLVNETATTYSTNSNSLDSLILR